MLLRSAARFCAPILHGGAAASSSLAHVGGDGSKPLTLNTPFSAERALELAKAEEERRLARQHKLYEDMLVFEGGDIKDVETLGKKILTRDFVQYANFHYKWGYYPKFFRKYRELMTTGFFDPIMPVRFLADPAFRILKVEDERAQ